MSMSSEGRIDAVEWQHQSASSRPAWRRRSNWPPSWSSTSADTTGCCGSGGKARSSPRARPGRLRQRRQRWSRICSGLCLKNPHATQLRESTLCHKGRRGGAAISLAQISCRQVATGLQYLPSPLVEEGGSVRSAGTDEGWFQLHGVGCFSTYPTTLRELTCSHKLRRNVPHDRSCELPPAWLVARSMQALFIFLCGEGGSARRVGTDSGFLPQARCFAGFSASHMRLSFASPLLLPQAEKGTPASALWGHVRTVRLHNQACTCFTAPALHHAGGGAGGALRRYMSSTLAAGWA